MQFRPLRVTEWNAKIARVKNAFLQPVMSREGFFLLSANLIDWYTALLALLLSQLEYVITQGPSRMQSKNVFCNFANFHGHIS